MKRIIFITAGVLLLLCLVVLAVFSVIVHQETANLHTEDMLDRTYLLSDEEMAAAQLDFRTAVSAGAEFPDGLLIDAEETKQVTLCLNAPGTFCLAAVYAAPEKNLFENPVDFTVGDTAFTSTLSFLWADDIAQTKTDCYGNEVLPEQYQLPYAASFLKEYEAFSGVPLAFDLPAGEVEITIRPQNQGLLLYGIYAVTPRRPPSYSEYLSALDADKLYTGELLTLQGEDYRAKSDSSIRGTNVPNVSVSPQNPYVKLINATADESNKRMGQRL